MVVDSSACSATVRASKRSSWMLGTFQTSLQIQVLTMHKLVYLKLKEEQADVQQRKINYVVKIIKHMYI